jgi:hypothetical protein
MHISINNGHLIDTFLGAMTISYHIGQLDTNSCVNFVGNLMHGQLEGSHNHPTTEISI